MPLKNFSITGDLLFQRCANPKTPTGGPKDTIPPTLIQSIPVNGATNINQNEIRLTFSEYINADKMLVRLIYVLISLFSAGFPGLLVYIIFWIVTPEKPFGEDIFHKTGFR